MTGIWNPEHFSSHFCGAPGKQLVRRLFYTPKLLDKEQVLL